MNETSKNTKNYIRNFKPGTKVVIVGAGITGIVAARELAKKGCKVTILEQSDRIAGKCDTFEVDGFEYNLGGHVLSQTGTVKKLAESVGIKTVPQPFSGADQVGEFCLYDFENGIVPRSFDMLEKLNRTKELMETHVGLSTPGYKDCSDLAAPIRDWLVHNDLEEMENDFRHAYTCAGYGFLNGNLSAAYYLKYIKANDLGIRPTCTPEGGFRNLLNTLSKGLDIRLNEKVISINRDQKIISTSNSTHTYDELFICGPNTSFLDKTPKENELLRKVKTLPYVTVIIDIHDFPDTRLFNLVNNVSPGHTAAFARFNPESDTYNVYGYLDEGMTIDDLVHNISEDFRSAGATTGKVHFTKLWEYFPHVSPQDFAQGFYDEIDQMQGENSTWFLGSLISFELTNCVVESAIDFINNRISFEKGEQELDHSRSKAIAVDKPFNSVLDAFTFHLENNPDKVLYTSLENDFSWTYAEMAQDAANVASKLIELGLGEKDAVILMYPPDSRYFPVGLFGCLLAGVIAVPLTPLDPNINVSELKKFIKIVKDLDCKYVLTDTIYKSSLVLGNTVHNLKNTFRSEKYVLPRLEWVRTDAIGQNGDWNSLIKKDFEGSKIAYLQYTSGSLSAPKAVTITHNILAANVNAIAVDSGITEESKFLGWVPWFHDMGLVAGFMSAAYNNAHYLFYSPLSFIEDPESWIKYIDKYKITDIAAPNFGYELAAKRISKEKSIHYDLSSLEHVTFGGERTRKSTVDAFYERFINNGLKKSSFRNIYGMAESVLYVTGATEPPIMKKFNENALDHGNAVVQSELSKVKSIDLISFGKALNHFNGPKILIVDPETRTICPSGKVGEIWISGPSVSSSYYKNKEATEECHHAIFANQSASSGFIRSGDLGFITEDHIFLCGRKKEVIHLGGRNIYPEDIELVVSESSSLIRKGCIAAFGVEINNQEQVVVVAEVKNAKKSKNEYEQEVIMPIIKELSVNLGISSSCIALVKPHTIPKTSSGKIQRSKTKSSFLNDEFEAIVQTSEIKEILEKDIVNDSDQEVKEIIKRSYEDIEGWLINQISAEYQLTKSEIDTGAPLSNLGIDSISVLLFVQRLSAWLGYHVELSSFYYHPSISELSRYLVDNQDVQSLNIPIEERLLVTINPELTGKPIYSIRPAGGSVMGYTELSTRLGRPIKAIQAASQITHVVKKGADADTVKSLAKEYADILLAQGEKIELLMGYSLGGTISFEMAKYMPDLKTIIMIDSAAPGHGPGQGGGDKTIYKSNADKCKEIIQIGWAVIFPLIRDLNRYNYFPAGVRQQFFEDSAAFLTHVPEKTEGITTYLIRGVEYNDQIDRAFQHPYYHRNDFGWRDIDPDVNIIEIQNAHHFTIMIEPAITEIANAVDSILEQDSKKGV